MKGGPMRTALFRVIPARLRPPSESELDRLEPDARGRPAPGILRRGTAVDRRRRVETARGTGRGLFERRCVGRPDRLRPREQGVATRRVRRLGSVSPSTHRGSRTTHAVNEGPLRRRTGCPCVARGRRMRASAMAVPRGESTTSKRRSAPICRQGRNRVRSGLAVSHRSRGT